MAQTNNTKKIKIKKEDTLVSSVNIIGQWVRIFDIKDGKKIKPTTDQIDTLNYSANKKYLQRQNGTKQTATWSLDSKKEEIQYKNLVFTMILDGQLIKTTTADHWDRLGKVTKDTLTININSEATGKLYWIKYYIRKK